MELENVNQERLVSLRQEGAVGVCEKLGVEALLATQHDNVQYVADVRRFFVYGWEPNSLAVITKEGAVKSVDCGKVGVDRAPWILLEALKSAMPEVEFVNAEEALLLERAVKNEEEQKLMRYAGWIAAEGVKAGLEAIRPGVTEYEVYGAFMGRLYELGSEGDGFYPFLSSGPISEGALYPTNRTLQEGDPVVIDMGPIYGGYNGDCMRTGFAGEPSEEFKELYRVNYESMYAGIEAIKPGIHISEVDAEVRRVARGHGYMEDRFDTGHGIGLNCCELPICMKAGTADGRLDLVLEPGMCFTLEPRYFRMLDDKTYIQAALEESVMVTADGAEVLTPAPFIQECLTVAV